MSAHEGPSRPRILVVDDDERNRALLQARLQRDYEVIEAESGLAALELLERGRVDLVLLDVTMPGMDGFETCRRIKARSGDGYLPVLLVTGRTEQDARNTGLVAGADEFLSKPFDGRELDLRVKAFLRLRAQERTIHGQLLELREQGLVIQRHLDELQHLQELKDDLFTLLVHDMRGPLTGVLGFLEVAGMQLQTPALSATAHAVQRARVAALKLNAMMEQILEVRRLEESTAVAKRILGDLAQVVRDAVATHEGTAASRKVSLEVSVGDVRLSLDPSLVGRAVENLVGNALKFCHAGSVVRVGVAIERDHAVVTVADDGPGVPGPARATLFRKFGASDAKQSAAPRKGFGLGLHLVKLVAEAHGGEAFMRDREGGGAVFGLTLSLATA